MRRGTAHRVGHTTVSSSINKHLRYLQQSSDVHDYLQLIFSQTYFFGILTSHFLSLAFLILNAEKIIKGPLGLDINGSLGCFGY